MATLRCNVALSWPATGGPGVNTWHIREEILPPDPAAAMVEALGTFYGQILASGLVPDGYTARFDGELVDVATDEIVNADPWVHVTSGQGSAFAALANQACMTMRTSTASKAGLGRKFFGPLRSGAVGTDGTLTDTIRATVQGHAATLLAESTGSSNGAIVVYSESQSLARDVTALTFRDYVAVLRSRRD